MTTRIAGQLPLDELPAPTPQPGPDRVEVTQPYIPAIRDEQPEFAKRLNPDPATEPAPATPRLDPTPDAGAPPAPDAPTTRARPAPPPRKRSLMRRVVRSIIGPDLLRKDPPKRR
ncbi:hypothetical protein IQ251_16990 [Saccharopolyspora sp. HNM0983]|uniref:Uncharacterized protein n=1 Tax=Saccharopolyspora montiporae TaxID=2781240 RepID=A0A929G1B7_9PSEU|nr:hypothetical protein [Saccharopolyspora sp. HNM0983]